MSVHTLSRGRDSQGKPIKRRVIDVGGRACIDTGAVVIGRAYVPPPSPIFKHAEQLQTALLEPRTATEPPAWRRALGRFWRWC